MIQLLDRSHHDVPGDQARHGVTNLLRVGEGVNPSPFPLSSSVPAGRTHRPSQLFTENIPIFIHRAQPYPTPLPTMEKSSATELRLAATGNKIIRSSLAKKRRKEQQRAKSAARRARHREEEALGAAAPPRREPVTIEASRVFDIETGRPLTREEALAITDEFTPTLAGDKKPRVVITTGLTPTEVSFDFAKQVLPVFPKSIYFERLSASIDEFSRRSAEKGYTDVIVVKEDKNQLSTLTHVHLPEGPTAVYKLSSFVPTEKIRGHGRCTGHTPEVILNNFTTQLGLRVGRMLGSLFPHSPNFIGRQVATFHNQRDFIFFRFHRYVFTAEKDKARLQELGPRFTLKLRALQKGVFKDPRKAEHEFKWKTKTDIDRRRFFL